MANSYPMVKTESENTAFLADKTSYHETTALHYKSYSEQFFYHGQRSRIMLCYSRLTRADHSSENENHRHQHQQEKEEGVCPVSRIWAACSSVLAASWFRLTSAASLFASARWLTAASLLASLSCSRARFRSIFACNQRRGSFCQNLQAELTFSLSLNTCIEFMSLGIFFIKRKENQSVQRIGSISVVMNRERPSETNPECGQSLQPEARRVIYL